jgi:hypothetical protein
MNAGQFFEFQYWTQSLVADSATRSVQINEFELGWDGASMGVLNTTGQGVHSSRTTHIHARVL